MLFKKEKVIPISDFLKEYKTKRHLEGFLAFAIVNLIHCKKVLASNPNLTPINKAGEALLSIAQEIGNWVFLIMALTEILRSVVNGDTKNVLNIICKYLVAYGSFYFLPYLFKLIRPMFQ